MLFCRSEWSIAILILAAMTLSTSAQTRPASKTRKTPPAATTQPAPAETKPEVWESWDTLRPEKEDFSILMPKDTATQIEPFEYHKMQLNARLYLSAPTTGPVVGVASISGIKSNPASYSDFERFNSYADAFKTYFPNKVRKDAVIKMILTGTKPFHGYTGRTYKLTIGDLNGVVNAYVTKKRFYAIAILNTKKDDALEEKFLSSFVIPDKPSEQAAVATNEQAEEANSVTPVESSGQQGPKQQARKPRVDSEGGTPTAGNPNTQEDNTESGTGAVQPGSQTNPSQQNPPQRAPINGGVLNGKAIYLPLPEIPAGEKAGVVMVQVLVDEQGSVISARAVSGPPNLHGPAVNAARLARFLPTVLSGEPVKVSGTLAYNFARAN